MTLEQKKKEIAKIIKRQSVLIKKVESIAKLKPAKTISAAISRAAKVVLISVNLQQLEIQKDTISSQPLHQFNEGGVACGKIEDVFISDGEKVINIKDFQPRK